MKIRSLLSVGLLCGLLFGSSVVAASEITELCQKIGRKLASVSTQECLQNPFIEPRFYSVKGKPILEAFFPAEALTGQTPRVLFIGGIHGDEYASVSVTFKWLNGLREEGAGTIDWLFLPLANPDGLLQRRSSRVNANKVDLNRNFTPAAGFPDPYQHWKTKAYKRSRYYPGKQPLSEPESQVIHQLIDEYQPDIIVSVHAPHGLVDFDGSERVTPPRKLGPLRLRQLGTYPGSLGNYGWFSEGIPVVTIELPYAGIMPPKKDQLKMWRDLVGWIEKKMAAEEYLVSRQQNNPEES